MKQALIIFLVFTTGQSLAQGEWSMHQCMQYAVEHNHEVKRAELELDNYKASKTGAIGRFLPSVDASIGAQYNFGRAIDPETNGYTDVSTFYNGYSLYASLPVFDGFSRIHALKAAGASTLMGRASLRQKQDQTALNVLQAYTNVAYYEGLVKMADEKVQETELLLKQIRLLEEVGRKSAADVAQVESQKAEADYELTRQQNLYASAMLELKKTMAFPMQDTLLLSVRNVRNRLAACYHRDARTLSPSGTNSESATYGLGLVQELNPELQAAQYQLSISLVECGSEHHLLSYASFRCWRVIQQSVQEQYGRVCGCHLEHSPIQSPADHNEHTEGQEQLSYCPGDIQAETAGVGETQS